MIEKLKIIFRYVLFRISAGSAYSIHSPFVYNLFSEVLSDKKRSEFWHIENKISAIRKELYKRRDLLGPINIGGKNYSKKNFASGKYISSISISSKEGCLLTRLIDKFLPENIIELGTGAGIGTLYLASVNKSIQVFTIEGNPDTAKIASGVFEKFNYDNIHLQEGTFDQYLPEILKNLRKASVIFIDGDHTAEALLRYYNIIKPFLHEKSILILHDIYWSADMQMAWKKILTLSEVSISIDVFYFGILFFEKGIVKQNFKLKIK